MEDGSWRVALETNARLEKLFLYLFVLPRDDADAIQNGTMPSPKAADFLTRVSSQSAASWLSEVFGFKGSVLVVNDKRDSCNHSVIIAVRFKISSLNNNRGNILILGKCERVMMRLFAMVANTIRRAES